MAENIDKIKSIIKQYIKIITQNKIEIEKIYLFGSYACGNATEDSDIDIAIISKDFEGDRFLDRRKIVPLRRKIDRRIEPIPFRTEDFKKSDPLALEIMTNGIEI
jgi:predicted nucleotidyltransferase